MFLEGYDYLMTDSIQKSPRQISIENGEQIVIIVIVYFALLEISGLIINLLNENAITVVDLIRWAITIVSCVQLYKGNYWAKLFLILSAGLQVITGVRTMFLAIMTPNFSVPLLIIFLILTIFNAVVAYYLLFSIDVDEFLKSHKA